MAASRDDVRAVIAEVNRAQESAPGAMPGGPVSNPDVRDTIDLVNRTQEAAVGTPQEPVARQEAPLGYGDEFVGGLARNTDQLQMSLYGLAQMMGREMGMYDLEDYGFRGINRQLEEIEATPISVEGFTDIESFEDMTRWLASGLGSAIPSMAAVMAGGVGTGALTSAVAKKTMERRIANTIRERMMRNLQKRGIAASDDEAYDMATRALQSRGGLQMVKDGLSGGWDTTLLRTPGFAAGSKAGAFLTSAGMQTGETEISLTQEGFASPQAAILAGMAGGALEAMPAVFLINRFFPGAQADDALGFVKDFAKLSKTGVGARMANSASVKGLLMEGSTEAGQELLQMAALAYHDPTFDLADPENTDQIINAFAQGALAGAFFGGAADTVGYARGKAERNRKNMRLKRKERFSIPKFTMPTLGGIANGGWPEGFTPADNTVFEEVKGRVESVVKQRLEPAFNNIRDQFETVSETLDKRAPGLNEGVGQFFDTVRGAHEEFVAGHTPIIEDSVRYMKEQVTWLYEQAQHIADPAKRKEWLDAQLAAIDQEVKDTADFIVDRAGTVSENLAKRIQGSQSVAMDEQLQSMFPSLDLSSKDADTFRGGLTVLDSDPDFTFGVTENYKDSQGVGRKRRTRGQSARGFKNKESAEKAIPRIAKDYPSASDSSFEAVQGEDGKWYVRVIDQGQREALIEDTIINESVEGARAVARAWDKRKPGAKKRQVKLSKSRSLIDVPTLVMMSRRLGDTFTMRQGFDSISGMMLERGLITDRDWQKMNEAFNNFFTKEEQELTLGEARALDDEQGTAGTKFSNVRQVLREMSKDAARTRFDRLTDVTEEMGGDFQTTEEEAAKSRTENELADMKNRGRPVKAQGPDRARIQELEEQLKAEQEVLGDLNAQLSTILQDPRNEGAVDPNDGTIDPDSPEFVLKEDYEATNAHREATLETIRQLEISIEQESRQFRRPRKKRKSLTPKQKMNKAIMQHEEDIKVLEERIKKGRKVVAAEQDSTKRNKAKDLLTDLENQIEAKRWSLANLRKHKANKNYPPEALVLTTPEPMPTTEERLNSIRKTAFVLTGMNPEATEYVQILVNKVAQMLPGKMKLRVVTKEAAAKMVNDNHPHARILREAVKSTNPNDDLSQAIYFDTKEYEEGAGITYIITSNFNTNPTEAVWALAHELGHAIHFDSWNQLSRDMQRKLYGEFLKDVRGHKRKTGAVMPHRYEGAFIPDAFENVFEFREWMADQFVNWMADRKAPRGVLERFLESVARKLDDLFAFMKKNESRLGTLNETYGQFADAVAKRMRVADPSGMNPFFLNEVGNAGGKPVSSLFQSIANDRPANLPAVQWRALRTRVTQNYPALVTRTKDVVEAMKAFYTIALAPSNSMIREIGKRVPTANKLVSIFNRDQGLAKKNRNYHDRIELMRGKFMSRYDEIVGNMTESQKQRIYDELRAIDGKVDPSNRLSPEAQKIRDLLDEAYEYMRDAGLPVGKIPNYLPRILDRGKLVANEDRIIQYLAGKYKHGSAEQKIAKARAEYMKMTSKDHEEAMALMELKVDPLAMQAPSLGAMRSRTTNDPFFQQFYVNNLDAVFGNYLIAVTKRGEYNRFFGEKADPNMVGGDSISKQQWNGRKNLELMLRQAKNEGATKKELQQMKDFVDANLGMYGRDTVPDKWRHAMAAVIAYQNMRVLLFTVFASLPDVMGPAIRTGNSRMAFRSFRKNMKEVLRKDGDYERMARAWGQISSAANQHVITEYVDNHFMPTWARKANNAFFKWTGLNAWTDFTRKAALAVGMDYIREEAMIHGDVTKPAARRRQAEKALAELGLKPETVMLWMENNQAIWGSPSYSRRKGSAIEKADMLVAEALIQFTNESILKPNASQRPLLASHPGAMLVYHLKGYMFAVHEQVLKRMAVNINRAMRTTEGKVERTYQIAALTSPAIMMMALTALGLELRELVTGDDRTERMDGWEYLGELFDRAGLWGIAQLGWEWGGADARGQAELAALGGPTLSQVGELLSRPASQTIPKGIPVVSQLPWLRDAVRDFTPL